VRLLQRYFHITRPAPVNSSWPCLHAARRRQNRSVCGDFR